jgi:hypothetical protein
MAASQNSPAEYVAISQIALKVNLAASRRLPLYITAVSQTCRCICGGKSLKKKNAEQSLRYHCNGQSLLSSA